MSEDYLQHRRRHSAPQTGIAPGSIWQALSDLFVSEAMEDLQLMTNGETADIIFAPKNVWDQTLFDYTQ